MSTTTNSVNGTTIVSGPDVLQVSDFFVRAGILHPVAVGSIAVIALFGYLRLGSNRSIAPITTFDWLINVALGSTLAGIVNGNSLTRGLLALFTMLCFQYTTSTFTARWHKLSWLVQSPPLVVMFRGNMLGDVMRKHRISTSDIQASLRQAGVLNVCLVEVGIIEPNGTITVFTMKQLREAKVEPEVLKAVPMYKKLCERDGELTQADRQCGGEYTGQENGAHKKVNSYEGENTGHKKDDSNEV